jgi:glucuronate isomerase
MKASTSVTPVSFAALLAARLAFFQRRKRTGFNLSMMFASMEGSLSELSALGSDAIFYLIQRLTDDARSYPAQRRPQQLQRILCDLLAQIVRDFGLR